MTDPPPMDPTETVLHFDEVCLARPSGNGDAVSAPTTWSLCHGDLAILTCRDPRMRNRWILTALGLAPAAAGRVLLLGRDPEACRGDDVLRERLRIGCVRGDDGNLLPDLTVGQNIALPLSYHQGAVQQAEGQSLDERTDELLAWVGLTVYKDRFPDTLSRAHCRQAALARAVALHPELLLLEVPPTGLDAIRRAWWRDKLSSLTKPPSPDHPGVAVAIFCDGADDWSLPEAPVHALDDDAG